MAPPNADERAVYPKWAFTHKGTARPSCHPGNPAGGGVRDPSQESPKAQIPRWIGLSFGGAGGSRRKSVVF
jgi:hypothetical protein